MEKKIQTKRNDLCRKIPKTMQQLENANCNVVTLAFLKDDLVHFKSMVEESSIDVSIFGVPIEKLKNVPEILRDLAEYILNKGSAVVGIFRVPGEAVEIEILKT